MRLQSKRLSRIQRDFHFVQLFLPLQRNGVLFILFAFLAIDLIRGQFYNEDSSFKPYLELFAWTGGVFILLVTGLGLLYTLSCWLYFLINKKKIRPAISIGLEDGLKGETGRVPVSLSLSKMPMPLIGYLKIRVLFEDGDLTKPVILNTFAGGWKDLLFKEGHANLWLSERKQYNILGYVISCEDYLQFFRFSIFQKAKKSFYLYPPKTDASIADIKPSKSQDTVERIKTSRRVEGDYLNYKDFESGDDVRRVVWKIFAKNKDLVVRIPEVINPYASHVYFFSSFYNNLSVDLEAKRSRAMLNYYKDVIYNICLSLEKTDRKVTFNLDQPTNNGITVEKRDELAYKLSCARWQAQLPPDELRVPASEAVLCVSSLIPATDLEELVNKRPVNLFIIRASRYLDDQHLFSWKNMFLQSEQRSEFSKLHWMLSRFRRKIKRNEKQIDKLIANHNFQGQII